MRDRSVLQASAAKRILLVACSGAGCPIGSTMLCCVCASTENFIMGSEVTELERQVAKFCGVQNALACSSPAAPPDGEGCGPGDAVFCTTFTFAATAEAIALQHATPVFIDVLEETFNIDPDSLLPGSGRTLQLRT